MRDNYRARRFWEKRPRNAFTTNGYEVIPDFLAREECERLVQLANGVMTGRSRRLAGNCYTWVKSEAGHGRNTQVREILNVNDIDESVARLMATRAIQKMYEERLDESVELLGFSIQIDGVDTLTKRDFHVDVLYPPLFKAFVYLTDVDEDGDGPYTIIPGSHRHFGRKVVNDLVNAVTSAGQRDMHRFAASRSCRRVLGPAGTLILSTQDAMHKGWSAHTRRPRYVLIAHGTTAHHFTGGCLTEGLSLLDEP